MGIYLIVHGRAGNVKRRRKRCKRLRVEKLKADLNGGGGSCNFGGFWSNECGWRWFFLVE
jgi:hypothetical protein